MKLEVYNKQDQLVALLSEDQMLLGYYPLEDFFRLNVSALNAFDCSSNRNALLGHRHGSLPY